MKKPYTYTVLRYVHDVTTGEFVNVGVVLFSPETRYAGALCRHTISRLTKTFPGMNGELFKRTVRYIQEQLAEFGERLQDELPFEGLPKNAADLAQTILPTDDSSLQWSPPGSGLAEDLPQTLNAIYERMVQRYEERAPHERRSDDEVWRVFSRNLKARHLMRFIQPKRFVVEDDELEFKYAWKNGIWHCLEPVSFDLSSANHIREKAHTKLGELTSIQGAPEEFKVYLLLGEPRDKTLHSAYEKAVSVLNKCTLNKELLREQDADQFSDRIADEMAAHG